MCDTSQLAERLKRDDIELWDHYQYAAVSIIIRDDEILLEKRNSALNDPWAGQFALPGGHYEQLDGTLYNTAIRETFEETGIILNRENYIGYFGPFTPRNKSNMMVIVHVFFLKNDKPIDLINSTETEFLGWIRLSKLLKGKIKDDDGYSFIIDEGTVWGMTARILVLFLNMCKFDGPQ